jgi:hypothetical protein
MQVESFTLVGRLRAEAVTKALIFYPNLLWIGGICATSGSWLQAPARLLPRSAAMRQKLSTQKLKGLRFGNIGHKRHICWLKSPVTCGNAAVTSVTKAAIGNLARYLSQAPQDPSPARRDQDFGSRLGRRESASRSFGGAQDFACGLPPG